MKKFVAVLLSITLIFLLAACGAEMQQAPEKIKVLILPKFETGEMSGDFPGEAQYYYESYCMGGEEYEIAGGQKGNKLYVKDGVALYVTGMTQVNTAMSLTAILLDDRFDFSKAYIFSTGCAGSAYGSTVMGDVVLCTATVDFELGHTADIRDLQKTEQKWFHDEAYDDVSFKILNEDLMNRIYELVKDVPVAGTEKTKAFMARTFENAEWATRDPMVLKGTTVSSDNYWKGMYDHDKAVYQTEFYRCPDPFAVSEMEDNALAVVADRMGMLDRFIVIRGSVNMDVFMNGATPEQLWNSYSENELASEDGAESADIFITAMKNNFDVGRVIIDAILNGTL